eukprot:2439308-Prymnesium_polylepis.1
MEINGPRFEPTVLLHGGVSPVSRSQVGLDPEDDRLCTVHTNWRTPQSVATEIDPSLLSAFAHRGLPCGLAILSLPSEVGPTLATVRPFPPEPKAVCIV